VVLNFCRENKTMQSRLTRWPLVRRVSVAVLVILGSLLPGPRALGPHALGQMPAETGPADFVDLDAAAEIADQSSSASDPRHLRVLFLVGLPGTPSHATLHRQIAATWYRWLRDTIGVPADNMLICSNRSADRAEHDEATEPTSGTKRFGNDRAGISAAIQELSAGAAGQEHAVWILMLGHGSFDGRDAFLHVPGPDLAARDYAALLAELNAPNQFVCCTMSCSGHFLEHLAKPGRVVVTATTADAEPNETEFPQAWADIMKQCQQPAARELDLDGDQHLSLLELLVATSRRVEQNYAADGRAPTEHAQLDDDGDGRGSEVEAWVKLLAPPDGNHDPLEPDAPDSANSASSANISNSSDGQLAARWRLLRLPDPEKVSKQSDLPTNELIDPNHEGAEQSARE
jgi:hypothetical protein